MLINPCFEGPEWRTFRLLCFIGTGLSAFAPIAHAALLFGFEKLGVMGVRYYLFEGACMIVGSWVYEVSLFLFFCSFRRLRLVGWMLIPCLPFKQRHFPERFWPGRFDVWGHSHTIFHVLVVLGTASHILGLLSAFDYNYRHRSCVGSPV